MIRSQQTKLLQVGPDQTTNVVMLWNNNCNIIEVTLKAKIFKNLKRHQTIKCPRFLAAASGSVNTTIDVIVVWHVSCVSKNDHNPLQDVGRCRWWRWRWRRWWSSVPELLCKSMKLTPPKLDKVVDDSLDSPDAWLWLSHKICMTSLHLLPTT